MAAADDRTAPAAFQSFDRFRSSRDRFVRWTLSESGQDWPRIEVKHLRQVQQRTAVVALAMKRGKSVDFTGYWQRHVAG